MSIEVKPSGEHGKKKWCVMRDGKVSMVCDTNSEACLAAAELARAEEEAHEKGKKAGVAAEKKKVVEPPKPPVVKTPASKVVKKVGKKKGK